MKRIKWSVLTIFIIICSSCELNGDFETSTEMPVSLKNLPETEVHTLFQNWYNIKNTYYGQGLRLDSLADQSNIVAEKQRVWERTRGNTSDDYYYSMLSFLADAKEIKEEVLSDKESSSAKRSLALFGEGAAIGSLALVFDNVNLKSEFKKDSLVGYKEALELALQKLDSAIVFADEGEFVWAGMHGNSINVDSNSWSEFLNTLAARFIVNSARNKSQREHLDWERVLNYAENGLTKDFAVGQDGWNDWWPDHIGYSIHRDWGRVNKRVIDLLHPDDKRLATDFQYLTEEKQYRHKRYDDWLDSEYRSNLYEMLKAENDLYKAEAYLRTEDLMKAAEVLNGSCHVTRGGLELVMEDTESIEMIIHSERMVELMNTGMGLGYFQMRGVDSLSTGTYMHFSIPGGHVASEYIVP